MYNCPKCKSIMEIEEKTTHIFYSDIEGTDRERHKASYKKERQYTKYICSNSKCKSQFTEVKFSTKTDKTRKQNSYRKEF